MQIKLQQAQSAKALTENMNKVLQVCPLIILLLSSSNRTTLKTLLQKKQLLKPKIKGLFFVFYRRTWLN